MIRARFVGDEYRIPVGAFATAYSTVGCVPGELPL